MCLGYAVRAAGPISLDQAMDLTRTGDIWLFRGRNAADRAIQTMTNSPVNHVGMSVVLDDLPPLMWHAELGRSLPDLWSGDYQRGVQLHDLRDAVAVWATRLRPAGLAAPARAPIASGDGGRGPAHHRPAGRHAFPSTARLAALAPRASAEPSTRGSRTGRPGDRLLRGGRRRHLRGHGDAARAAAAELVRPRPVLERRGLPLPTVARLGDEIAVVLDQNGER